jgi:hypothetical protein
MTIAIKEGSHSKRRVKGVLYRHRQALRVPEG